MIRVTVEFGWSVENGPSYSAYRHIEDPSFVPRPGDLFELYFEGLTVEVETRTLTSNGSATVRLKDLSFTDDKADDLLQALEKETGWVVERYSG
jgi:hypothetical protein